MRGIDDRVTCEGKGSDMKHKYTLGKVDYNRSGRRNCKAAITWEWENGRFSMCAEVWNPRETDIYCGGQCVEEVAGLFPNDAKAQRMLAVWRRWHLNDMKAGSPRQEEYLREHPAKSYDEACAALAAAGLNPDGGYAYGSKWLREEVPADVVAEIESW